MELMLDIETLDTAQSAVVLSIGVMLFDRDGKSHFEDTVYPSVLEQQAAGRTVSLGTVRFWMEEAAKDPAAMREAFVPENEREPVRVSMEKVRRLVHGMAGYVATAYAEPVEAVWANGDIFDLGIVCGLFGWTDPPWRYNAPRDLRTLMREAHALGWIAPEPREGHVPHSAVSDCRYQVDCLMSARRFLGSMHGARELMGRL